MPLGSPVIRRFRIMNDCDEPVAVPPKVEYHMSPNVVGVFENAANLWKIVPSNLLDDSYPCLDLLRRIWVRIHGLV